MLNIFKKKDLTTEQMVNSIINSRNKLTLINLHDAVDRHERELTNERDGYIELKQILDTNPKMN